MIIDGLGPPGPKQIKIPLTPSDGCIHFTIKLLLPEQLLRMKRVTSEKKEKETGRYVGNELLYCHLVALPDCVWAADLTTYFLKNIYCIFVTVKSLLE